MHKTSWNWIFLRWIQHALWCPSQMNRGLWVTPKCPLRPWSPSKITDSEKIICTIPFLRSSDVFFSNPRNLMLKNLELTISWCALCWDSARRKWLRIGLNMWIPACLFCHRNQPRFRGFDGNDSRRHHVALPNGEAYSNQSELGYLFLFGLQEKVCDEMMRWGLWGVMWFGLERRKHPFSMRWSKTPNSCKLNVRSLRCDTIKNATYTGASCSIIMLYSVNYLSWPHQILRSGKNNSNFSGFEIFFCMGLQKA